MRVGFYNDNYQKQVLNNNNLLPSKPLINNKHNSADIFVKSQNISFNGSKDTDEELRNAAKEGSLKKVKSLLSRGADFDERVIINVIDFIVNSNDTDSSNKGIEITKLLFDNGLPVNYKQWTGRSPLMHAAESSDKCVEFVSFLLEHGADPNFKSRYNVTPLMIASQKGNIKIVKKLLEKGADPNIKSDYMENGLTALMYAVENGNNEIAKNLLEKGADPNIISDRYKTALMYAVKNGSTESVKFLLENGADPNIKEKYDDNNSALIIAIQNGNTDAVKILLDNGADPNIINSSKMTPLMTAAKEGNTEAVKTLLEKGADSSIHNNNEDMYALTYAITNLNVETVRLMLDKDVDPNLKQRFGENALWVAIEAKNAEIITNLLESGVNTKMDPSSWTIMMKAVISGSRDVINALVNNGVDINMADKDGTTALMLAAKENYPEALINLLDNGADINLQDKYGKTAMKYAVDCKNSLCADIMVRAVENYNKKAKRLINLVKNDSYDFSMLTAIDILTEIEIKEATYKKFDEEDSTFLHLLAKHTVDNDRQRAEQLELISLLIKLGSNINAKDRNGNTPLTIAAMRGDEMLVKYLLKKGADQNVKNSYECTPLFYAEKGKYAGIVNLLQDSKE